MKSAAPILAALIASFLWAPVVAASQWGAFGPWFTGVVGHVAQVASPSQRIVAVGTVVFTPRTEVTLTTACDGFVGIRTFSILFGVVFLLNWRSLAKLKFVALYLFAVAFLWCHNVARIAIAIIVGHETHFGTSEIAIAALAGLLALVSIAAWHRFPRVPRPAPAA